MDPGAVQEVRIVREFVLVESEKSASVFPDLWGQDLGELPPAVDKAPLSLDAVDENGRLARPKSRHKGQNIGLPCLLESLVHIHTHLVHYSDHALLQGSHLLILCQKVLGLVKAQPCDLPLLGEEGRGHRQGVQEGSPQSNGLLDDLRGLHIWELLAGRFGCRPQVGNVLRSVKYLKLLRLHAARQFLRGCLDGLSHNRFQDPLQVSALDRPRAEANDLRPLVDNELENFCKGVLRLRVLLQLRLLDIGAPAEPAAEGGHSQQVHERPLRIKHDYGGGEALGIGILLTPSPGAPHASHDVLFRASRGKLPGGSCHLVPHFVAKLLPHPPLGLVHQGIPGLELEHGQQVVVNSVLQHLLPVVIPLPGRGPFREGEKELTEEPNHLLFQDIRGHADRDLDEALPLCCRQVEPLSLREGRQGLVLEIRHRTVLVHGIPYLRVLLVWLGRHPGVLSVRVSHHQPHPRLRGQLNCQQLGRHVQHMLGLGLGRDLLLHEFQGTN